MAQPKLEANPPVPYKQIRAFHDEDTITLYQAYSASIAIPAVRERKLCASPDFMFDRMTWIKPSWCWMMYRSGYSYKDERQAHILALKMKHAHFRELLSLAVVTPKPRCDNCSSGETGEGKKPIVRVQWDPERSPRIGKLAYRSIQIGIPRELINKWATEWIESIEDVTDRAREMKRVIDEEPDIPVERLVDRGLMPKETVYEIPLDLQNILDMAVGD